MPSLKDIRRRIVSIKNTQKITRAMKLVSAAKFARANTAIVAARPYAKEFLKMQKEVLREARTQGLSSSLVDQRSEQKSLVVIVSTDRGFCGSLNSNLFKTTSRFLKIKQKDGIDVHVIPWGKRARLFSQKQNYTILNPKEGVLERLNYQRAKELANELITLFLKGDYDRVYLSFVEFRSALVQNPKITQLLPVELVADSDEGEATNKKFLLEPNFVEIQKNILERGIRSQIFRILLESAASEHGARMTAMDSATNNASEVLRKMNIQYARARQAAITKELIEITSGAEALGN